MLFKEILYTYFTVLISDRIWYRKIEKSSQLNLLQKLYKKFIEKNWKENQLALMIQSDYQSVKAVYSVTELTVISSCHNSLRFTITIKLNGDNKDWMMQYNAIY